MNKNPLEVIKENDSQLFDNINETRKMVFGESALPLKEKLLIAIALDASHGAINGVRSLALQAKEAGATKEEIMDAVRVAYFISGVGSVYVAAQALDEIL